MNPVATQLQAAPRVFSLQIAWQTNHETPADIAATLAALDEEVGGGEGQQGKGCQCCLAPCLLPQCARSSLH